MTDVSTVQATVTEGASAPDFSLPTDGDGSVTLSGLKGHPVVVYFYPKDDTSGCTKQAIGFTEAKGDFDALGVTIIGISPDSVSKHDKFIAKHDLAIQLAADEDKTTAEAYGVWVEKSMYGKKYMGVERSTFLVDKNGVIAKAWRKVKVPGHVDAVLDAAKAL
ncbi:MAG: thioredoxin-dependent thiol peroxidase [Cohaesibacteraceae bacterium]